MQAEGKGSDMSNFAFLEKRFPQLCEFGLLAEAYVYRIIKKYMHLKGENMKSSKLYKMCLVISILMLFFISCGSNTSTDVATDAEEKKPEQTSNYTENQEEMGNTISDGVINVSNGWVYVLGDNSDVTGPALVKMRTDASDKTELMEGTPNDIIVNGEYVYAVIITDTTDIYRVRLGGDDKTKLVENARDLQIDGDYMYYSTVDPEDNQKTIAYYRSDLEGKNQELILDKNIYVPYIIGNQLFYQDDADGETIHLYDLNTKEDKRITDSKSYSYILNDDYIYYIENDNSTLENDFSGTLVKMDLSTQEKTVVYDGAYTGVLVASGDNLYFSNANDDYRLYSIGKNGDNINLVTQDDFVQGVSIYGDKIGYCDWNKDYEYWERIYIANHDGSDKVNLTD